MMKTTSFALVILLVTSTLLAASILRLFQLSHAWAPPLRFMSPGRKLGLIPAIRATTRMSTFWPLRMSGNLVEGCEFSLKGYVDRQLIVANGLLYLTANDGYAYAYSVATRTLAWKYNIGSQNMPTVVTAAKGVLYVGSLTSGALYALDATTGALLWKYQTNGFVEASPTVVDGVVYFGGDDYYVYALKASTGELLWKYGTGNEVSGVPAVANGVVYAASGDGYLYALDANNGALLWTFLVGRQYPAPTPVVANGMVYFVVAGGGVDPTLSPPSTPPLVCWYGATKGASSPRRLWPTTSRTWQPHKRTLLRSGCQQRNICVAVHARRIPMPQVAIANGVAYVGGADTRLVALNAKTGSLLMGLQHDRDIRSTGCDQRHGICWDRCRNGLRIPLAEPTVGLNFGAHFDFFCRAGGSRPGGKKSPTR